MRFIVYFLLLFFSGIAQAMDSDRQLSEESLKKNQSMLLQPVSRLKKVAILASHETQAERYGRKYVGESTWNIINQLGLDPAIKSSISFKRMNSAARNTLNKNNECILGMKSLMGRKTVWINEDVFLNLNPETQNYLINKAISETDYWNPELKTIIAGELCGITVSYNIMEKAKALKELMETKIDDPTMNNLKRLFCWKDAKGAMRIHPNLLKVTGMGIALTAPLLILPHTPIEKRAFSSHSQKSIVSSSASQEGLDRMKTVVGQAQFNNDKLDLSTEELEDLKKVVAKRTKQIIEKAAEQELDQKHPDTEKFNYYWCMHECQGKECDCERLFLENEEYKKVVAPPLLLEWCKDNYRDCKAECLRKALRNPGSITKPHEKKNHDTV